MIRVALPRQLPLRILCNTRLEPRPCHKVFPDGSGVGSTYTDKLPWGSPAPHVRRASVSEGDGPVCRAVATELLPGLKPYLADFGFGFLLAETFSVANCGCALPMSPIKHFPSSEPRRAAAHRSRSLFSSEPYQHQFHFWDRRRKARQPNGPALRRPGCT